jgi:aldose 1-epimerase
MTSHLAHQAFSARREHAGTLADGTSVEAVTLVSASGISARILSYGATLQSLTAPDPPNRPSFGSARLDPGETYRHNMIYRLSAGNRGHEEQSWKTR